MGGTPAIKNDKLIDTLAGHFPKSYSTSYGISSVVSHYLMYPQLRGFWPFSSVNESGNLLDISGQSRLMTNTNSIAFAIEGLIPYANLVAASSHRFERADEAGTSITGGITVAAWVNFDAPSTGAETGIISKWLDIGNQRSYALIKTSGDVFRFQISDDGTGAAHVFTVDSTVTYTAGQWYFILGKFVTSTSLSIMVNGVWTNDTTGIPASIFNNTQALYFGYHNGGSYLDGKLTLAMLAAQGSSTTIPTSLYHHTRPLFGVRS